MKNRFLKVIFSPLLLLALFAWLIALRLQLVELLIGSYLGCPGCFDTMVLAADAMLFAAVAGLLLLAGLLRPLWLGRLVQVAAGLVILVYAADLVVFRLFNSRLFLSDVRLYLAEPAAVWNQFSSGLGGPFQGAAVLMGAVLTLVWMTLARPARLAAQRALLVVALAGSLAATAFVRPGVYVNDWAVDNVFAANLATSEHTHYSPAAAKAARAARPPGRRVSGPAAGHGLNVVVVILESWSAWHSAAWGGFEDWTPHLDAAANRGTAFTDFHSIGFSTDRGLAGILAGQALWAPFLHPFEMPPFHSMWGVQRSLPRAFKAHGYHTAFLTSGPLDLYRKGEWLHDLGFDEVEGNEHPFYAGEPRYAFDAASDRALYARAGHWLQDARRAGAEGVAGATRPPYLLVLETVTTHQPYTDPETGERSLERAMRYADRAFAEFLDALQRSGFFESGLLLVVSDHRSMTPVPARELAVWGSAALSRVPAFAIGRGFEPGSRDARVYSQSDLVPSFELWLGGETVLRGHQDVMFGSAERARHRCVFHSRFDLRGRVDVHCGRSGGQVHLDGDASGFVETRGLDPAMREDVLNTLTVLRLDALERHQRRGRAASRTTH